MVAMASPAQAQERQFSIAAGSLKSALEAFAKQSGTQLIYRSDDLGQANSGGASGAMSAQTALDRILSGSGFRAVTDQSGAVAIVREAQGGPRPDSNVESLSVDDENQEIVVTGTNIRGQQAAGSKVITITRDDIERSGYGRIQDVLAQLPQNFGGNTENSPGPVGNLNFGQEIQLRGLGPGTTLTLVNGQRKATGGLNGQFVDISSIAPSAVDRIEILPDGASALYGSDAIGGVVNIVLRKDFQGLETRVRASSADGDARELQASALWGAKWSTGNVMVGIDYYDRKPLRPGDRAYTAAMGDFRRWGGLDFRIVGGTPGTIYEPTGGLIGAIPRGHAGVGLQPSDVLAGEVNYVDNSRTSYILPKQRTQSAFASIDQELGTDLMVSLNGSYSRRNFSRRYNVPPLVLTVPTENPFNNFGRPVVVIYDITEDIDRRDYGVTNVADIYASLDKGFGGSWTVRASASYAQERTKYNSIGYDYDIGVIGELLSNSEPSQAFNPFGSGSSNPSSLVSEFRVDKVFKSEMSTWNANVIVDGPLVELPAGSTKLALGADYREENYKTVQSFVIEAKRHVASLFAELAIPIFRSRAPMRKAGNLDLSLAGRFEHYSDFGSTFNPKLGLSWHPFEGASLRGTWGTSFRAASLGLLAPSTLFPGSADDLVADPLAPNGGPSWILHVYGSHPDIKEETSKAWTLGIDVRPVGMPLRVSATLFRVDYRDRVDYPTFDYVNILNQEELFAPIITRNPSPELLDQFCNKGGFYSDCLNSPYAAIVDSRLRNLARVVATGIDYEASYRLDTDFGSWDLALNGVFNLSHKTQFILTAPLVDFIDVVGNPQRLKITGSVTWSIGDLGLTGRVNHSGDTKVPGVNPVSVDSSTTVDAHLGYQFTNGWFRGTKVSVGAVNIFDAKPPFVFPGGYDQKNASLLGRLLSFQVMKRW